MEQVASGLMTLMFPGYRIPTTPFHPITLHHATRLHALPTLQQPPRRPHNLRLLNMNRFLSSLFNSTRPLYAAP